MTTNQTIDGVPREAFKWALEQLEEDGNKGCGYFDSLRALLDAPVLEPQDNQRQLHRSLWKTADPEWTEAPPSQIAIAKANGTPTRYVPAAQPQGVPVAYLDLEKIQSAGMAYATKMRVNHRQTPPYAERPAPVAVVRCSFCDVTDQDGNPWSGGSATQDRILIYRVIGCKDHKHLADACLAEVARLNPSL